MGCHGLQPRTQRCEATLDMVDISPHSTTGAHGDEQQQIIVQGLDKPHQSLHIIWYLSLWQATSLLRQQVGMADGGLHPHRKESPPTVTCCFLLTLTCISGLPGSEATLDGVFFPYLLPGQ